MTQKELIELLQDKVGVLKTHVYIDKKQDEITDITYNSKACKKGSAFFVKGVNFKSEYVKDAEDNGASVIIAEREYETTKAGIIIVEDVRLAMVVIAEAFFGKAYEKINMVALTGTKGKTTTATYLHNIFNCHEEKKTALLSTIKTYTGKREEDSHLSTPEAIELQRYIKEAVDSNIKFLTMEVSSQAYKTNRILDMKFNIGAFLNISEDHISPAEHPNFTDYLNCKLEFIKNCKTVVVNYETSYLEAVLDAAKNAEKIITFGSEKVKDKVEYYYTNLRNEDGLMYFDVMSKGFNETFVTQMLGDFNAENAIAAIVMAHNLGVSLDSIKEGIIKTTVSGRMNVFKKGTKTIIVDYAHNKISFEKFFAAIKKDYPTSDIIAVFGAPGGKAYGRRKDMSEVASKYCNKIYLTADDPQFESVKDICLELASYIECTYEIIEERKEAIEKAYENMKEGSVLCLLAKGEDKYQQIRGKFEDYESDIEIAKRLTK